MNFFLDTNILLDFLLNRKPHFDKSVALFSLASKSAIKIYTSSHCFATAHYVAKKNYEETQLRDVLFDLADLIEIIPVDSEIIQKSLKSQHKDFEDAIQIFCAHQIKGLDGIITRNLKDFSTSEIEVYSPDEALYFIKEKLKN